MKKFGHKSNINQPIGQKALHTMARFGSKAIGPAVLVGSALNPEIALPIGLAGIAGEHILDTLQKKSK